MDEKAISWVNFDNIATELANKIDSQDLKFDKILAIGRGGLILGVVFSHIFSIPIHIIFVRSYDGKRKKVLEVNSDIDHIKELNGNILVCDDIVDTGETLQFIIDKFKDSKEIKHFCSAALFCKEETIVKPDFYIRELPKEIWVRFPWEK